MKVKNWAEKSHPYVEHYKINKRCVFVQKFRVKVSSFRLTDDPGTGASKFGDYSVRITSFATKEHIFMNQSKEALSNAGLSYKGPGDKVICFECGIVLKQWVTCDIPICEHIKWSPYCPYVKAFVANLDSILELDTSSVTRKEEPNHSPDGGLEYVQRATRNHFDSPRHQPTPRTPTSYQIQDIKRHQSIFDHTQPTDPSSTNETGTLDEEIKGLSISDQIEIVVSMDFDRKLVETIAREQLDKTGKGFADAEELCAAVLDAQEDVSYNFKQSTGRSRENHQKKVDKSGVQDEGLGISIDYIYDTNNIDYNSHVITPSNTDTYEDEGIGNSLSYQSQLTHEKEDVIMCKICWDKPVGVTFQPCGHLLTCNICSLQVDDCPICRRSIHGRVKTYLP
ncbi:hypothetical protein SNE40_017945 [Patella caerulea]